ncbi:conserved hypothetical protein [Chelatococcus asaccharovorans]|nr:conserved hypothetical protein [Chelatococcus asaccharovorans]
MDQDTVTPDQSCITIQEKAAADAAVEAVAASRIAGCLIGLAKGHAPMSSIPSTRLWRRAAPLHRSLHPARWPKNPASVRLAIRQGAQKVGLTVHKWYTNVMP